MYIKCVSCKSAKHFYSQKNGGFSRKKAGQKSIKRKKQPEIRTRILPGTHMAAKNMALDLRKFPFQP
jgi:ribosomal protein L35